MIVDLICFYQCLIELYKKNFWILFYLFECYGFVYVDLWYDEYCCIDELFDIYVKGCLVMF